MRLRVRALVLAAGEGRRLRPLTDFVPKALLPVGGLPVVAQTLARLAAIGCEEVALNLHHLGDRIRAHLGDSFVNMPLRYSPEEVLLGTLGALAPLREFFAAADLAVIVNGDSLCRWPLRQLVRCHLRRGAEATLLLHGKADPAEFGGGVGINQRGRVCQWPGGKAHGEVTQRLVFAGAHVFAPALLQRIGEGPADFIADFYQPLLEEGAHLQALITSRTWHDLGTPRRYLEATRDWCRGRWPARLWRRRCRAKGARVEKGSVIRGSVVEGGARVERGARIEASLVMPAAIVGRGSFLRETIVGQGVVLPPQTWVTRRMITRLQVGKGPGEDDSVVGGLVYTPLDAVRESA